MNRKQEVVRLVPLAVAGVELRVHDWHSHQESASCQSMPRLALGQAECQFFSGFISTALGRSAPSSLGGPESHGLHDLGGPGAHGAGAAGRLEAEALIHGDGVVVGDIDVEQDDPAGRRGAIDERVQDLGRVAASALRGVGPDPPEVQVVPSS